MVGAEVDAAVGAGGGTDSIITSVASSASWNDSVSSSSSFSSSSALSSSSSSTSRSFLFSWIIFIFSSRRALFAPSRSPFQAGLTKLTPSPHFRNSSPIPFAVTEKKYSFGYLCASIRWRRRALGVRNVRVHVGDGMKHANCMCEMSFIAKNEAMKGTYSFLTSFSAHLGQRIVAFSQMLVKMSTINDADPHSVPILETGYLERQRRNP